MIEIELPDGTIAEFPDGMPQAEIEAVLAKQFAPPKEKTGNAFTAFAEPALTMASGIIAEPIAGLAGMAASMSPLNHSGAAADIVGKTREALTYQPRTDKGASGLQAVGDFVEPVTNAISKSEEFLGDAAFNATGSPAAGAAAASVPTLIGELLGVSGAKGGLKSLDKRKAARNEKIAQITSADPNADIAKYMVTGSGKVKKDKIAINAINQGFDEGIVSMVKGSTPTDKAKMAEMVSIWERGDKNPKFQAAKRPSDVVGRSLIERFNVVRDANRTAGSQLNSVAKSLKGQPVDVSEAVTSFIDDLDEIGVSFNDKALKLDYKNSDLEGLKGVHSTLDRVINRMARTKAPDAYDVHRMKKFIDEQVTYGKNAKGLGGKAEFIVKSLRKNLDSILDNQFPEYNNVNTVYAETIDAIDDFQAAAGKKIDLNSDSAAASIGTLTRRILSNAQSRTQVMDTIKKIQDVAKKNGGSFDDDIVSQVVFVDEISRMFGSSAKTSFQGEIKKAGSAVTQDVATQSLTGIPAGSTINWLKSLAGKSPRELNAKKAQALKELLLVE